MSCLIGFLYGFIFLLFNLNFSEYGLLVSAGKSNQPTNKRIK